MVARCPHGAPAVIAVEPTLEDGTPFPTTFWLTCPVVSRIVAKAESAGEQAAWSERARRDGDLADGLRRSHERYAAARRDVGGGADPCSGTGVAGERDPLRVKCLHARVAAAMAGLDDPVGAHYTSQVAAAFAACTGEPCGMRGTEMR